MRLLPAIMDRYAVAFCTLLVAVVPAVCLQQPSVSKGVALVVANTRYQVAPLNNASEDAVDVAAALTALGFDVVVKRRPRSHGFSGGCSGIGSILQGQCWEDGPILLLRSCGSSKMVRII